MKFKNYLIIFCALFCVSFIGATIKRADDFERKYFELRVELNKANSSKRELLEAQKEAILNQHDLSQRLVVLNAKNVVLNKHYDALKDTYKCERPADAEQVIMQGVCDYAEATGGGCK